MSLRSGNEVGQISLGDDGQLTFTSDTGRGIFDQYRRVMTTDQEAFDALATGWSNGYLQIPALSTT